MVGIREDSARNEACKEMFKVEGNGTVLIHLMSLMSILHSTTNSTQLVDTNWELSDPLC